MTWLPNQLFAVMELMREVWESITVEERDAQGKTVNEMMDNVYESYDKLQKEVQRWCQERDPKASQAEAEALRRLEA